MGAAVIGEAFDTAVTLGLALRAWIALTAATVTLALVSLCVAVVWVCEGVWRGVAAAAAAMGARNALSASLAASSPSEAPELLPHPPGASQARSAHSAPAWARTDKDTP